MINILAESNLAKSKTQLVLLLLRLRFCPLCLLMLFVTFHTIPHSFRLSLSVSVSVAHKMASLGAAIIQFIRQHFSAKFMRSVYNVP